MFVEIPLNTVTFHVEVAPIHTGGRWRRFLFNRFRDVLDFSAQEQVPIASISIQTRRRNGHEYSISRLKEVYEATSPEGQARNLFVCADGETIEDEISGSLDSAVEKVCIWSDVLFRN